MWLLKFRSESMIASRSLAWFVVFIVTDWSWAETVSHSSLAPKTIISALFLFHWRKLWHIQSLICSTHLLSVLSDYSPLVIWLCKFVCHLCRYGNILCCFPLPEPEKAYKRWIVEVPEWSPGVLCLSFSSAQMFVVNRVKCSTEFQQYWDWKFATVCV